MTKKSKSILSASEPREAERRNAPGVAIGEFFIPTLTGNAIGGVALVAAINYARVYLHEDQSIQVSRQHARSRSEQEHE